MTMIPDFDTHSKRLTTRLMESIPQSYSLRTTKEIVKASLEALQNIHITVKHPVTGKKLTKYDLRVVIFHEHLIPGYFTTSDGHFFSQWQPRTGRFTNTLTPLKLYPEMNQDATIVTKMRITVKVPMDLAKTYHYKNSCTKVDVHRIVARSWIPFDEFVAPFLSPEQLRIITSETIVINHRDGDATNNCYTNLEYVTQKENGRHAAMLNLNEEAVNYRKERQQSYIDAYNGYKKAKQSIKKNSNIKKSTTSVLRFY